MKLTEEKSTLKAKLKAASQEEKLQKWKEYFKNQFGKPAEEIINEQEDIKIEQFTEYELNTVLKKKILNQKKDYRPWRTPEIRMTTYVFDYTTLGISITQ